MVFYASNRLYGSQALSVIDILGCSLNICINTWKNQVFFFSQNEYDFCQNGKITYSILSLIFLVSFFSWKKSNIKHMDKYTYWIIQTIADKHFQWDKKVTSKVALYRSLNIFLWNPFSKRIFAPIILKILILNKHGKLLT